MFLMENPTNRFEVTYVNPDTRQIETRVIDPNTPEFMKLALMAMDGTQVKGKFVSDDTPLGIKGRAKQFHYRRGSTYADQTIKYHIDDDGVARFDDFKPFMVLQYLINSESTDDGDLLSVDLRDSKFAPTDRREVNNMAYILKRVQEFNQEMMTIPDESDENNELEDDEHETPTNNDQTDPEKQSMRDAFDGME